MSASVEQRACRVVAEVFDLPEGQVTMATSRDTVEGWDSVNVVNLVMALEGEFGVTFTMDEAAELLSTSLIVALLREKGVT